MSESLKPGDKVWVTHNSTPGHERKGFYGTVFSVFSKDESNGRQMLIVESSGAPNGRSSVEWAHHCSKCS